MNITAVIVTFNRLKLLKKTLEHFDNLSYKPSTIIIVNNNSNDGTKEFLETWAKDKNLMNKIVLNLDKNIGGSGGFYEGMKEAIKYPIDWLWVSDDDAFPEKHAFENFIKFLKETDKNLIKNISVISGQVISNGKIDLGHRRRLKFKINKVEEYVVGEDEYNKNYFQCDLISYVGTFINVNSIQKVGLTEKDFFIYYDDTEHSLRLCKVGKVYCAPSIKIEHNVDSKGIDDISWKSYYAIRNRIITTKKHFSILCYFWICLHYFKIAYKNKNSEERKLYFSALLDGIKNIKGVHEVYKPGWIPNNENLN